MSGITARVSKTIPWRSLKTTLFLLAGLLTIFAAEGATIGAINHTHWAINRFSVDGRSFIDSVGPYQGGGGGCCYAAPPEWRPGMTVQVDWETGVGGSEEFPGFGDWTKFLAWKAAVEAQRRRHSKQVGIPDYTGQRQCGITVDFLPCDQLEVTTSCYAYGNPQYPIKTPLHLPEPKSCMK